MFQKRNVVLVYILLLILVFVPNNVFAVTATFTSHGSALNYTYNGVGHVTYLNKKLGNKTAYCGSLGRSVPKAGVKCKSAWNLYSDYSYIAAQIIKKSNSYLDAQLALNCLVSEENKDEYGSRYCGNKALLKAAKKEVKKYKYKSKSKNSTLNPIKASYEGGSKTLSNKGGQTYVSRKITLSGLIADSYGGKTYQSAAPKYTISIKSASKGSANICTSDTYSTGTCSSSVTVTGKTSYSFYVVLLNGGVEGGNVVVNVKGTNKSKYPAAYRWSCGSAQTLITGEGKVEISRSIETPITLNYTKSNTYSVSLAKVDENGENLPGASLSLFTAKDENGKEDIKELCSISPSDNPASCTKNGLLGDGSDGKGYTEGRFLCYSEGTEPSGYKKITTKCQAIKHNSEDHYYMEVTGDNGEVSYQSTTGDVYNKYQHASSYCITNSENNFDNNYVSSVVALGKNNNDKLTQGACEVSGDTLSAADDSSGEGGSGQETPSTTSYSKTICVTYDENENNLIYDENDEYCNAKGALSKFVQTSGNASLEVSNALNTVNISKKAITGADEIAGAQLSIYTTDDKGNCTKTLAKARKFEYQPFVIEDSTDEGEEQTENNESNTEQSDNSSDSNSSEDNTTGNNDDSDNVNIADGLSWDSSYAPAIISGLNVGSYCLIEELAPKGYKKVTSTIKFSMDSDGGVKLIDNGGGAAEKKDDENGTSTISIRDEIIDVTVSKTDAATSKELPGATLSICGAYKNDDGRYELIVDNLGDCSVVELADGTLATWTSTDKPHVVHGLGSGTYYLVETVAPKGYSTAESILFVVQEDGTLTDINGKSLADSKLVMKDSLIKDTKTGMLGIFVIVGVLVASSIAGVVSYLKLKKK